MPDIAILIPAYKAEKTIKRTLASLEANDIPHDVYLIDDGSPKPLKDYISPPHSGLTLIRTPENRGIAQARNIGLKHILEKDYRYIAMIDADDVVSPNRLSVEKDFLDSHPEIGFVGSWAKVVSEKGETAFHLNPPTDHKDIIKKLCYNNCFIQPSLMFRSEMFRQHGIYSEEYPSAEDYEIVLRFSRHTQTANLPNYLIDYTISLEGISQSRRTQQLTSRLRLQWKYRNWKNIHFYLGIVKTIAMLSTPNVLITALKKRNRNYKQR